MTGDRDERVLGVLYERPGPHGFGSSARVGRIRLGDALAELATLDCPTTDDAARARYEARIAERLRRRGGGGDD
jgi:hypothetical protein